MALIRDTGPLVPGHRGLTVSTEDREVLRVDQEFHAVRDAECPPDETGAFEDEHHFVHAGRRNLEVPLHVGFCSGARGCNRLRLSMSMAFH